MQCKYPLEPHQLSMRFPLVCGRDPKVDVKQTEEEKEGVLYVSPNQYDGQTQITVRT